MTAISKENALASVWEVFWAFLKLGCISFGGPVAHLAFFRQEFVNRRKWLDDDQYSDLVALTQLLPGPASSQTGIALGLLRAGWAGSIAAWLAFTLPSAVLMTCLALGLNQVQGALSFGVIHGLKIAAVAVVAQALWGMYRSLCPTLPQTIIAGAGLFFASLVGGSTGQMLAIIAGAMLGLVLIKKDSRATTLGQPTPIRRQTGALVVALYLVLLLALPLAATYSDNPALEVLSAFYHAGGLVFGGGHVVLPLLEGQLVDKGWIASETFLTGYGAVQAMPGPLFTFSSFLGASLEGPITGIAGSFIAVVGIFLPGYLLVVGALPFWQQIKSNTKLASVIAGANSAVVGVLGAAFYNPVITAGIYGWQDVALALLALLLLVRFKVSPVWVVLGCGFCGALPVTVLLH